MTKIADFKAALMAVLPAAVDQALSEYREFTGGGPSVLADPKVFREHHAACKAALMHLDSLLKLARWAADNEERSEAERDSDTRALQRMMVEARETLSELAPPEDDDG